MTLPTVTWSDIFNQAFLTSVLIILALIFADVWFGIGLAIKQGKFEFNLMAQFYRTSVIPNIFGWLGVWLLTTFARLFLLSQLTDIVTAVIDLGFYGLLIGALSAQIGAKVKALAASTESTVK